jgi:two-component system sensor histidine kinase KdpD
VVGLVGVQLGATAAPMDSTAERALEALIDQAAIALERQELMEERAIEGARAETEALRTALLTSLGHDLRTPLTAIRGAIATLRESGAALPEATRADLLAAAEEETVRLAAWLGSIIDIVRLESGQVTPRRETVDIAQALRDAARRATRRTGRVVAVAAPPALEAARLDPALLDQVLGNLLDNALKFSGPAGQVAARAQARTEMGRAGPGEVEILVEDDGPGIAPADLPRIFDPFFRASRTDRVAAGSGLGLAIAHGLTRAMGGQIAAESPIADGHGTRLGLRFPAA